MIVVNSIYFLFQLSSITEGKLVITLVLLFKVDLEALTVIKDLGIQIRIKYRYGFEESKVIPIFHYFFLLFS